MSDMKRNIEEVEAAPLFRIPKFPKIGDQKEYHTLIDASEADVACVNTIRCLSAAIVTKAKSGHPGAPMGCAVMAHALYGHVMKYNPNEPTNYYARDRFVLSNGHASALLYLMLHLSGHDVSMADLQAFRQWGSKTPGHPESHMTPGVEVTTGPLGQGIAQAVGLAIGARIMKATFGADLFDNKTYCILGDGCMQEGVAFEACALAGHLQLGGLIALYDRNGITIDGDTDLSFTEDVAVRFQSQGWKVFHVANGNTNLKGLLETLDTARTIEDQPVLIVVDTTIGYGSEKQGTSKVHGAPLPEKDIFDLRGRCGLSTEDLFQIPSQVLDFYKAKQAKNIKEYDEWKALLDSKPDIKKRLHQRWTCEFTAEEGEAFRKQWLDSYDTEKADAPRNISQAILKKMVPMMETFIGGSADLMESNKTDFVSELGGKFHAKLNPTGRYIHYGVREHGMVAISNGLAAYGGFSPFNSTFLNFYTYAWGAIRVGALSHLNTLMIATHDSIELGEDGPTHQPVEVPALLRSTPNVIFARPSDGREIIGTYLAYLNNWGKGPFLLALARGKTQPLPGTDSSKAMKGGYVVKDFSQDEGAEAKKKVCLASSGSELQDTYGAVKILEEKGYNVRLVSMVSWSLFDKQTEEYKRSVIPEKSECANGIVEPFNSLGVERYFEMKYSTTLDSFGASAPAATLKQKFGFTSEAIATKIMSALA